MFPVIERMWSVVRLVRTLAAMDTDSHKSKFIGVGLTYGEMLTQPPDQPQADGNINRETDNTTQLQPRAATSPNTPMAGPSLTGMRNEEKGKNHEVPLTALAQLTSLGSTDNKPQPQAATSLDDFRELICLVEGDSNLFLVKAPANNNVLDLKKLIHLEKDQGILRDVNSSDLILWKLKVPIAIRPSRGLTERIKEQGEVSNFAEELDEPIDKVLDVFMRQPSEDDLHIIVKLPVSYTVKRSHSPDASDGTKRLRTEIQLKDRWLSELHSKIWGRKELWSKLIREIEITADHYVALQDRLTERDSTRDSSGYMGGNVQGIKLDFLRLIPSHVASAAPPAGGNEQQLGVAGRDDDENPEGPYGLDDELRACFPSIVRYLDLSSLELRNTPPRIPLPLFIRPEYKVFSDLLYAKETSAENSAIVSGQPGIGKTAYLYLQMIEKMISGCPFLHQTLDGNVYHISDVITQVTPSSSLEMTNIVAFVDADAKSYEPNSILVETRIRIILASSPKGTKQFWPKQYPGLVLKYAMALWSPIELFITGIFLNARDLTYARLKESAAYFGFNPRRCFNASVSSTFLLQFRLDSEENVKAIPETVSINTILADTTTQSGISHLIFELSPKDNKRLLGQCQIQAVSRWTLGLLLELYETRQADAAARFYHSIASTSDAASLRGRIMEIQTLKYFHSLTTPMIFNLRSLDDSSVSQWTYPGPAPRVTFQSKLLTPALQPAVEVMQASHFVPAIPNFPAVDSIVYDPNEGLVGIQVTVQQAGHGVAVTGLQHIQRNLKQGTSLAGLRPSVSGRHWRLIFVVPDSMADGFPFQPFVGDTRTGEWAKKIDQYVLGLPENSMLAGKV